MGLIKGMEKGEAMTATSAIIDRGGWAIVAPSDDPGGRRFLVGELNPIIAKMLILSAAGAVSSWWNKPKEAGER